MLTLPPPESLSTAPFFSNELAVNIRFLSIRTSMIPAACKRSRHRFSAIVLFAACSVLFPNRLIADSSDGKGLTKAASWNWSSGQSWSERLLSWIEASAPNDTKSSSKESAMKIVGLRGIELHEGI